ncbi:MAG: methylaspartate ammonia-lyase [Dehalococcoidia bacterium]
MSASTTGSDQQQGRRPRFEGLIASSGLACDYVVDGDALAGDVQDDGLFYAGSAVTPGFSAIVERARCLNLQLVMDNGDVALGDCLSVIRSGSHGRASPLIPELQQRVVADEVSPRLIGRDVGAFREMAAEVAGITVAGEPLHPAVTYGLSQALLNAAALTRRCTMAEVVADEYGLPRPTTSVPIFGCADWRYPQVVDRMIASGADALPHGGFTSVESIGDDGEKLVGYVLWASQRVRAHSPAGRLPSLHVDVYGTIGEVCGGDLGRVIGYLEHLAEAADPLRLSVEDPVRASDGEARRQLMAELVRRIDRQRIPVSVVADENCNVLEDIELWASEHAAHMIHVKLPDLGSLSNSVEAALACHREGVGVYIGGTMNDTDVSGRAGLHLALAVQADLVMAKPGMWPDVSIALTRNEMSRTLRLCALRRSV